MSSQFTSPYADQTVSPTILQPNGTARLYGPSATRTQGFDDNYVTYAQQYQSQYPPTRPQPAYAQTARSHTAFYNTRAGEAIIAQARADLSARAKPVDSSTHKSTLQDNKQRVFHSECVLPANLANQTPTIQPIFQQYPLQEYNRWNMLSRSWSGPTTHPRLKSVPYSKGNKLDVPKRHDLVKNLKKNYSISNHNHGLPFLAKHTNNLVSC